MKAVFTIQLIMIAALSPVNGFAQESLDPAENAREDGEMYLDEIRATCEAEAAGLPDAQAYVAECIRNLKRSFADQLE